MSYYVMETLARQRQEQLAAVSARPNGVTRRPRRSLRAARSRASIARVASGHRATAVSGRSS